MSHLIKKERNLSIDVVKIIAMFGVICWHTSRVFIPDLQIPEIDTAQFFYRSCAVSIPLFFLVSGFLQCGRNDISVSYCFKKIFNILKYVFFFCIAYWLLISIRRLEFDIQFLWDIISKASYGGGPFFVFWYFSAMIILYFILPFINKIFVNKKLSLIVVLFLLLTQNCIHLQFLTNGEGYIDIKLPLRLYNWITYFMLGGLIKRYNPNFHSIWIILFLIVVNFFWQLSLCDFVVYKAASFYYSSAIIVVLSSLIMIYCLNTRFSTQNKFIKQLSKLFLPVFTIHPFLIDIFKKYFIDTYCGDVILLLVVSITTVIFSYFLMKIPYINRIIKI